MGMLGNPKSEVRSPKEARKPKSEEEARKTLAHSRFGFRISDLVLSHGLSSGERRLTPQKVNSTKTKVPMAPSANRRPPWANFHRMTTRPRYNSQTTSDHTIFGSPRCPSGGLVRPSL